jgi:hypothetical protein
VECTDRGSVDGREIALYERAISLAHGGERITPDPGAAEPCWMVKAYLQGELLGHG